MCRATVLNIEELKNHWAKTDPSHILDTDKENETTSREGEDLRQTIGRGRWRLFIRFGRRQRSVRFYFWLISWLAFCWIKSSRWSYIARHLGIHSGKTFWMQSRYVTIFHHMSKCSIKKVAWTKVNIQDLLLCRQTMQSSSRAKSATETCPQSALLPIGEFGISCALRSRRNLHHTPPMATVWTNWFPARFATKASWTWSTRADQRSCIIPHESDDILLLKLFHLGVRGKVLTWLKEFLKNRKQKVRVRCRLSEPQWVTSGKRQQEANTWWFGVVADQHESDSTAGGKGYIHWRSVFRAWSIYGLRLDYWVHSINHTLSSVRFKCWQCREGMVNLWVIK